MIVGGASDALVFPVPECKVPDGLDGPGMSRRNHTLDLATTRQGKS